MSIEFQEIGPEDLLLNAKNRLRGLETDYDNITMTGDQPQRVKELEEQIEKVKKIRDERQKVVDKIVADRKKEADAAVAAASK